ncbi:MAG: S-layer homology domain-containing protein, partial [Tissierellia bacterium]|nr:S-layer homology domain-containing protein [Tissierellia bacterium]
MKRFLVFILILMMVVPVQVFAEILPEEPPKKETGINGTFEISVKTDDQWIKAGNLGFGKFQETKEINLGENLKDDAALIKITQNGGGASCLDAVFLDGVQAIKANGSDGKVLNKLSKEDLDVTPVEDGITLEFKVSGIKGILSVTGRIEPVVIGKEPIQFPILNTYKNKNDICEFYTYTLGSNIGTVNIDGNIEEINDREPFVKEFRKTGSGHPFGDVYFWVMNDDENLYVIMDLSVDNTYDGDKDYGKVFINSTEGIKEFKVSVPETKWGNTSFIYTDKVPTYEHKVYEFKIPLSELGKPEKIEIAFAVYGTSHAPGNVWFGNPDIAYGNNFYLSVFNCDINNESNYFTESYICGEILDSDGNVVSNKFKIYESNRYNETPTVAYDIENNCFLVVWSESIGDGGVDLKACTVNINDINNPFIGEPFPVSGNESGSVTYYELEPDLTYGKDGEFLLVWEQQDSSTDYRVIYGRIINSEGNLKTGNFPITSDENQHHPIVSFDSLKDAYIVTWERDYNIEAQIVKSSGEVPDNGFISIATNGEIPHVSINNSDYGETQFLVTWYDYDEIQIKGQYIRIDFEPKPVEVGGSFLIASYDEKSCPNYPVSYGDGKSNMLCAWIPVPIDEGPYYVKLQYIDDGGGRIGSDFYTDVEEYDRDKLYTDYSSKAIGIAGDNKGYILIAYQHEYVPAVGEYNPGELELPGDFQYLNSVGYRIFGEREPELEFVNTPYEVQVGETLPTELRYFNGTEFADINYDKVTYFSGDTSIATISTSGAITGVSVGTTTVSATYTTGENGSSTTLSAITWVEVESGTRRPSSPGGTSKPVVIGQIIVDGKVVKDIYAEDLVSNGGIYSFEATKTGDNARLWLLGSSYKQIANKNTKGTLQLIWDAASYNLPLKSEEVLKEVNSIAGSKVNIILEKVDDEKVIDSATVAVDKLGGKMVSGLVDFSVTVEGKSKETTIDRYNMYVTRTMDNLNNLDAYSTSAMKLIDDEFTFAPSVFDNGTVMIKYRGNGTFAIVNYPKSFSDITNHWSKMNIEKLAARNIAFGKNEGIFAPNDYVTRAEFAVMITRALAITEEEGTMNFEDVNGWFEKDISTAYTAGLINGRSDGKFYPNENIQRKDMTVMIRNALKFAGKGEVVKDKESVLSMFTDSSEID